MPLTEQQQNILNVLSGWGGVAGATGSLPDLAAILRSRYRKKPTLWASALADKIDQAAAEIADAARQLRDEVFPSL